MRPPLDERIDLSRFKKFMPLADFFKELCNPEYRAIFVAEREDRGAGKRRGTIYQVLNLEEIVYGLSNCSSDISCIMELLKSNYVTEDNYEEVYIQLNELIDTVVQ
jgi:hypothetical protein